LPITYIKVILIYIPVRSAGGGLTDYIFELEQGAT